MMLLLIRPPSSPVSKHLTRAIHSINVERFARAVISSRLITHPPSNLSDLIDCYNSTLTNLLDKHAPLVSKNIRSKPSQPWFTLATICSSVYTATTILTIMQPM